MYEATLTILTLWKGFLENRGPPQTTIGCMCKPPCYPYSFIGLFGAIQPMLIWGTILGYRHKWSSKKNGTTGNQRNNDWLVSTYLKNMSQIGSFPQARGENKNIWNHNQDDASENDLPCRFVVMFMFPIVSFQECPPSALHVLIKSIKSNLLGTLLEKSPFHYPIRYNNYPELG